MYTVLKTFSFVSSFQSKKFKDAEAPRATQSSGDDPMDLANQLLKTAEEMVQGFVSLCLNSSS